MRIHIVTANFESGRELIELFWDLDSAKAYVERDHCPGEFEWKCYESPPNPHNDPDNFPLWEYGATAIITRCVHGGSLTALAHCAEEQ